MLLHGLAGSARAYDRLAPLLERAGHAVVRVNRPGAPSYAIRAQAADALRAFDGVADVVVGHSMGGHVAVAMAEQAPDRVRRLVLVDTAPTVESRLQSERGTERLVRTRGIDDYLRERPLAERIAALDVVVDVVHGTEERRVAVDAFRVFDDMPGVRVMRLEGVGHSPIWEDPEAVARVVAAAPVR